MIAEHPHYSLGIAEVTEARAFYLKRMGVAEDVKPKAEELKKVLTDNIPKEWEGAIEPKKAAPKKTKH